MFPSTSPRAAAPAGSAAAVPERAEPSRAGMHQIGEVAEQVGLSLRTVRYYEEVGLLTPSARTQGGFRLYSDEDIQRLLVIKQMKPLGFSLEAMRELLEIRERLGQGVVDPAEQVALQERLERFAAEAAGQAEALRAQLAIAETFAATLRGEVQQHQRRLGGPSA